MKFIQPTELKFSLQYPPKVLRNIALKRGREGTKYLMTAKKEQKGIEGRRIELEPSYFA